MEKTDILNLLGELKKNVGKADHIEEVARIVSYMEQKKSNEIRSYKPELISNFLEGMEKSNIESELIETYKKIIILEFMALNWAEVYSAKYSDSVQAQYRKTYKRIFDFCEGNGWINYNEDVYWKELSMANQQMFPARAQVVEAFSGFGFRQGVSTKLLDSLSFIKSVVLLGGKSGYYQIHTHSLELDQFNEQGWTDCYIRLASMLEIHSDIKGVCGGSWFYDPKIREVSPRLSYLRQLPINNGAKFFYNGIDESGNALSKSKTRVKLYEENKYTPTSYFMIWPRGCLIKWAKSYVNNSDQI